MIAFTVIVSLNKVVGKCKSFIVGLNRDIFTVIYIYWLKATGVFASSSGTMIYKQTGVRIQEHT
jgi:hypothetical protein